MFRPKPPEERPGTFRPSAPLPVPAEKLRPKTYEEIRARVLEEMRNQEEKTAR
jgi:hypothetical protein